MESGEILLFNRSKVLIRVNIVLMPDAGANWPSHLSHCLSVSALKIVEFCCWFDFPDLSSINEF